MSKPQPEELTRRVRETVSVSSRDDAIVRRLFDAFDADGSGKKELDQVLAAWGELHTNVHAELFKLAPPRPAQTIFDVLPQ